MKRLLYINLLSDQKIQQLLNHSTLQVITPTRQAARALKVPHRSLENLAQKTLTENDIRVAPILVALLTKKSVKRVIRRSSLAGSTGWDVLQAYMGPVGDLRETARQEAMEAILALEQGKDSQTILETLKKVSLRGGKPKQWLNGGFDEVKEEINKLKELAKTTLEKKLITLEIGTADEQLVPMLPVLKEAFSLVQEYVKQAKRRARLLDFADIEVHALLALEDEQVQNYYAQRWKAF